MIYVAPGAQKTDGYQANRNLTLSSQARADSIPGLEILADDVRCTHGATVGKVDPEQIFYLQSRSNQSEYDALLKALTFCRNCGMMCLEITMDSKVVISQVTGEWRCLNKKLKHKRNEVYDLLKHFTMVRFRRISGKQMKRILGH